MTTGPTQEERDRSFRRVQSYYQTYPEWDRLEVFPDGRLEFEVNKSWIQRNLPPPGARVLDLGGGPGRYSIWLAQLGYRVTLADLSTDLIEIAQEKATEAEAEIEAFVQTNAIDLKELDDDSFDAVLCMGPMYHLLDEKDRHSCAKQLFRVARGGAPVFVAFINRLPVARGMLAEIPPLPAAIEPLLTRWFETGVFVAPGRGFFTDSYYAHPDEVKPLLEGAGFRTQELIGSETVLGGSEALLDSLHEKQPHLSEWVMDRLIEVAREPSVVGAAWHLLYIGRKP
jgi:2-polyprenyl-3-methyl-5-hydroxy-6-metoxy-1,4-benzoquinol methylase